MSTADLLVHVVDGAATDPVGQIEAVRSVLNEIGANEVPELLAINKADRAPARPPGWPPPMRAPLSFSALTGRGVPELLRTVADRLRRIRPNGRALGPGSSRRCRGSVAPAGRGAWTRAYEGEAVNVRARLDDEGIRRFREFVKR